MSAGIAGPTQLEAPVAVVVELGLVPTRAAASHTRQAGILF
jgi:hypothetical protein